MASEPQPSSTPPAASPSVPDPDDAEESTDRLPKTAEDRKAAAALSSLTAHDETGAEAKAPSAADREALGKAMSRLQIAGGEAGAGAKKAEKGEKEREAEEKKKKEEERKRKVKVDQADVSLLVSLHRAVDICCIIPLPVTTDADDSVIELQVEELELTKAKATDLLKSHDGDAVKAMRAFVTSSA
jgi:hypothetical protein